MSGERARLFVALELPDAVRSALVKWSQEMVGTDAALRPMKTASLHVTLCFLGWQPTSAMGEIAAACDVLQGTGAPRLSLAEAMWLPKRRPRVLAVGLDDPDGVLAAAQSTLAGALSAGGWYEPESRPFLAHVTATRIGRGAPFRARASPAVPSLSFESSSVTLYRSILGAGGARYEGLGTVSLLG